MTQKSTIKCLNHVLTMQQDIDNTELKLKIYQLHKICFQKWFYCIQSFSSWFYWCNSKNFLITNAATIRSQFFTSVSGAQKASLACPFMADLYSLICMMQMLGFGLLLLCIFYCFLLLSDPRLVLLVARVWISNKQEKGRWYPCVYFGYRLKEDTWPKMLKLYVVVCW